MASRPEPLNLLEHRALEAAAPELGHHLEHAETSMLTALHMADGRGGSI